MRLVVSRFFNESYLMPWWLKHHREIFDHGILIDSNSTDDTSDICRTVAPDWEIVKTEVREFTIIMADFEVMKHEARFPDAWKIALNTSEFLVSPRPVQLGRRGDPEGPRRRRSSPGQSWWTPSPTSCPVPIFPLTQQKDCGFWEEGFDFATAAILGHKEPYPKPGVSSLRYWCLCTRPASFAFAGTRSRLSRGCRDLVVWLQPVD